MKMVVVMDEEKIVYCVYCGTKNNAKQKKCEKCENVLNPKGHNFRDFLYKHIKEDFKSQVKDNIFSLLTNFIKSHLYGSMMSISLIFMASTIIIANISYKGDAKYISKLSDIGSNKISNEVVVNLYTYDDYCTYEVDVGTTSGYIISGEKYLVEKINLKKNTSIKDYCENNNNLICKLDVYMEDEMINKDALEYQKILKEYISWYDTCKDNLGSKKCINKYTEYNKKLSSYFPKLTDNFKDLFNKEEKINKDIDIYLPYMECEYVNNEM